MSPLLVPVCVCVCVCVQSEVHPVCCVSFTTRGRLESEEARVSLEALVSRYVQPPYSVPLKKCNRGGGGGEGGEGGGE